MNPPQRAHQDRVRRWWRRAFVLYAVALTTATHWPQLELPPAGPDDKTIHVIAFALLTFLLWQTRWIGSRSLVMLIAIAWSLLDELGQAIPVLNRVCTPHDMFANAMGVIIMVIWLWACAPVGGMANRLRIRRHRYLFERTFALASTWATLTLVTTMIGVSVFVLIRLIKPAEFTTWLMIAFAFWLMFVAVILRSGWSRFAAELTQRRPCLFCDEPNVNRVLSADHHEVEAACPGCAAPVSVGQWTEPPGPTRREALGYARQPLMILLGLAVIGVVAIGATVALYADAITHQRGGDTFRWVPGMVRHITRIPSNLARTIDLSLYLVVFAVLTRVYRLRLAGHYDQHLRCRRCGHDLRGTPVDVTGQGSCGECGGSFVATPPEAAP